MGMHSSNADVNYWPGREPTTSADVEAWSKEDAAIRKALMAGMLECRLLIGPTNDYRVVIVRGVDGSPGWRLLGSPESSGVFRRGLIGIVCRIPDGTAAMGKPITRLNDALGVAALGWTAWKAEDSGRWTAPSADADPCRDNPGT